MDSHVLTPELAGRMAVTAVTADIEYLARTRKGRCKALLYPDDN